MFWRTRTGRPKGVKMTYEPMPCGEIPDSGKILMALYGYDENMVYLSPAPLYHAAPLRSTNLALYAGGTVVVMQKFDAARALA